MDFQEQYSALMRSDPAYDGRFFVGVRTTGVFCRPVCRARKPKAENCEFYVSTKEALSAGYRPCKLCHPLESSEPVPAMIAELLAEVDRKPNLRLRDDELRLRGLDPDTVRRWFKRHRGLTFQGYQRARRLGVAFDRLGQGGDVTTVAQDAGFESLSGFGEAFKKRFGKAPTRADGKILWITRLSSPLGVLVAGAVDGRLCLLKFGDRDLETELLALERRLDARAVPGTDPVFSTVSDQLDRYFAGTLHQFDLPLELPGTDFQNAAWKALLSIPFGQTRSYRDQAESCGRPEAVRAIGTANGANPVCIVVPCHRVVGSDGSLTGYSGGIWRKRWLLDFEAGRLAERR